MKLHLKGHGCKWTATPTADASEGRWDEQGINEYNVAMSATETEATNARCLGHDPLVENGVDEDSMVYLVLPFVKSAREGVARLGKLIENMVLVKVTVSLFLIMMKFGISKLALAINGLPKEFQKILMQFVQILWLFKILTLMTMRILCMLLQFVIL